MHKRNQTGLQEKTEKAENQNHDLRYLCFLL